MWPPRSLREHPLRAPSGERPQYQALFSRLDVPYHHSERTGRGIETLARRKRGAPHLRVDVTSVYSPSCALMVLNAWKPSAAPAVVRAEPDRPVHGVLRREPAHDLHAGSSRTDERTRNETGKYFFRHRAFTALLADRPAPLGHPHLGDRPSSLSPCSRKSRTAERNERSSSTTTKGFTHSVRGPTATNSGAAAPYG